jgi:hypothetical protein
MQIAKGGKNETSRRDEHDAIFRFTGKEGAGERGGCMLEMRNVACSVNS